MSSVRSLANLHCTTCNEVTLHRAEICIGCSTVNQSSGNAPVPREAKPYGYATIKAKNHNPALQEQADARRRARRARHQVQRGVSK